MDEQRSTVLVKLEGGPRDGQNVLVYDRQTTASINHHGTVVTYRKCSDGVWRYVPAMDETVGED